MKNNSKKAISLFLCATMILAGCSNNAVAETEETTIATTTTVTTEATTTTVTTTTVATTTEPEIVEFVANEDIKVISSFIYDNHSYFVVCNNGETPILDVKISYITFDSNGFTTIDSSGGYETVKATAVNLMPGDKTCVEAYGGNGGKYAKAVATYIKYKDGTEWEASDVSLWSEEVAATFDVSAHKAEIDALKSDGEKALSNEYLELYDVSFENRNRYSSDNDYLFSVKNKSDLGVQGVTIFILEFDENGMPVSVSPYDTYCKNCHYTGGTINLGVGESDAFVVDLLISGSTKNIKSVIGYITFADESTWENPYLYEWIITNHSSY